MPDERPYYRDYEDRYAAVYAGGAEFWTADPVEIRDGTAKLQDFLDRFGLAPGKARLIEFGCGEGHLAEYLVRRGYEYRGIDLSPSAVGKARGRVAALRSAGGLRLADDSGAAGRLAPEEIILLGDITEAPALADGGFDAAIDNFCLHMLVADSDRRRYLATVRRVLASGGAACFHENHADHPIPGPISSFDDFIAKGGFTPGVVDERTILCAGGQKIIPLTRVPFRALDEAGHRRELHEAGLEVTHFAPDARGHCVIHARRIG